MGVINKEELAAAFAKPDKNKIATDSDKLKEMFNRSYGKNASMQTSEIPLSEIEVFDQVRTVFKDEEISELAESIKLHGLLTPITVMREESGKFRLVCGEKRYRACKSLGMQNVPANIFTRKDLPDWDSKAQILILQMIENLQRSNPSLPDYVRSVDKLRELKPDLTGKDLMNVMNKGKTISYDLLAFSKLDENEKAVLFNDEIDLPVTYVKRYCMIKNNRPDLCLDILQKGRGMDKQGLAGLISSVYAKVSQKVALEENKDQENSEGEEQGAEKEGKGKKKDDGAPKSQSVNFKKIDKYIEGLSDSVSEYMFRNNIPFDKLVADALDAYLASH